MNPLEHAFAVNVRKTGPDGTKPDGPMPRWPIHEDKQLGDYILNTVQAPAGSLSIKLSPIVNAGSGLFTTRDVGEGELIFTSVPLVLCAEVGDGMEACDFCFQQRRRVFHPVENRFLTPGEVLPPLHVCNGCRMYQYCSKSCWQRAWDTGHLYECGLLSGASTDLETRTLYRLLILMRKKVLLPEQVQALGRLESEAANLERRAKRTWPKIQALAREAKERTKSELGINEIIMLYGIIRANALPVDQTYRNAPLGIALDLGGALLNHDCDPNVVIVFNSTQVQVRALRKLKAGEELLHCYRDIAYDFTFRNPRITSRYQFRCQCNRCRAESDRHCREARSDVDALPVILSTQAALFDIIDESKKQAWAVPSRFDITRQTARVDSITKTGYAGRPWPNNLEPLPTVLKALAALCERQGDLVNSVKIRIKALAFTSYRKGLPWSEDLIDLVLCLSTFTMFPSHPALRDPSLPKHKEFQDVFIGHLHALHGMLVSFYGDQGRVTGIVRTFLQSETTNYNGPRPATRAFRRRFKASQEAVLKWAGVDEKLWTVE
ncbi:hypothetical protein J3F83DRAFT_702493 [Trichoderma novae-zelandiae]